MIALLLQMVEAVLFDLKKAEWTKLATSGHVALGYTRIGKELAQKQALDEKAAEDTMVQ